MEGLIFLSATELARIIREKEVSSFEVVKACLARIEAVNPRINAVVQLTADTALEEARESDRALAVALHLEKTLGGWQRPSL